MVHDDPRKSNEANFMALLNFIVDPAVILDEKGRFLAVNDAFVDLIGLRSKKKLIGMMFLDLDVVDKKNKAKVLKNFRKRMQGLHVDPYEINFTDKTGEDRFVELKAKKINYSGQQADLVILRDITQRKENARKLEEYSEKMEALVNEKIREIKENKEKLETIVNSSPDAFTLCDLNGKIIECNEATLNLLGYSPRQELIGKNAFEMVAPKDQPKAALLMESLSKNGSVKNLELAFLTKDGKEFIAEASASIIKDDSGNSVGLVAIAKDITERKHLEDALRSSEEMFRAISTSAMDSIILVDESDKVVYWNPAAEKIFGYIRKEAMGNDLAKLVIPPQGHKPHLKLLKKLTEGSSPEVHLELTALRKDGIEFPMELSATSVKLKDRNYMLGIVRDVSEHKKMEDKLRQERDMLEAVTENIGAGLAIISKDYRVLWANKLLKQMKQINGNCEDKICYSAFNRLAEVCPDCGVQKVFDKGVPIETHEHSTNDAKGNPVRIQFIVTPIKDEKGKIVAALELAVDITERKRMEDKLAEYSQQLEKLVDKRTEQLKQMQAKLVTSERLATIGELAAMVGHDLRNPLTGIMGATYYLKTKHGAELGAKGKEMLETIEKAINHSNKIVNDLLEYSRKLKLDLTKTTPKALLKNTLPFLEIPRKIQIVDATEGKPKVRVDTEKMVRVFVNIIQNAIDAMPEGGTLKIKSRELKSRLIITFKDSGMGMSKETLRNLWTPLFTTKAKGMGFGLPICKRIAEAHGGKLSVKSKIGKGTTVTVTIPVNPKSVNAGEEKLIFNESILSAITATKKA